MWSTKFERVKRNHPKLSDLLETLNAYVDTQLSSGQQYIVPKLTAAELGLTDGEAFVLLELLAREGMMQRVYNVYCRRERMWLTTVDSLDALEDVPHCDYCDKEHDASELSVEIAFRPTDSNGSVLAA